MGDHVAEAIEWIANATDIVAAAMILIGFGRGVVGFARAEVGPGEKRWDALQGVRGTLGTYLPLGIEFMIISDIRVLTAQLHKLPLFDDAEVGSETTIGPKAAKPLRLRIPLFVSDRSFGALSEEAKVSLAMGAELAGTGICSGEGGMLPEEQESNSRYFYELASGMFGFEEAQLKRVQAFHFKSGQGAKTGTGGHLPASKVVGKIAAVRGLEPGTPAVSPPRFAELDSVGAFRDFGAGVREISGGIPVGFKMSAQHIEKDIDFALEAGADYIILDGRGGGTGSAPLVLPSTIAVDVGNITHVLLHNDELGKITKEQRAGEFEVWKTDLHNPNFAEYAKLCGAVGIRVEAGKDLDDAMAEAPDNKGPALVEIMTDALLV